MQLSERIKMLIKAISYQVYEKDEIFKLGMLALLGGESIFLLGKPGIAKSLISRRLKFAIHKGINFEYLMSKFSTPEEIYGPIDLRLLKDGVYLRNTDSYLPSCNVAFLDEIWKAGPSIQNTLLTIINEKLYRNGGKDYKVPLKLLISASNELPAEGEGLEALFDRFIIRYIAEGLKDEGNFLELLDGESSLDVEVDENLQFSLEELDKIKKDIFRVKIGSKTFEFINFFRKKLVQTTNGEAYISDRRWKKIAGLMKTSAFVNDRAETDIPDLFVIPYCIWDNEEQESKYKEIFNQTFFEFFGQELRNEKKELFNEHETLQMSVTQIETQFLRFTPYSDIFKNGKFHGTYYAIEYSSPQFGAAFISAADWNKVRSLPSEQFTIEIHFGKTENKYEGSSQLLVQGTKADQILFVEENNKYTIRNDNPAEYRSKMSELTIALDELNNKIQEHQAKVYKEAKKYQEMECVFFDEYYSKLIDESFNGKNASGRKDIIESENDVDFNDQMLGQISENEIWNK